MGARVVIALAALSACELPKPPAPRPSERIVKASTPETQLKQTGAAKVCRSECSRGQAVEWAVPHCLAKDEDLVFVSNDCERVVVLSALPKASADWAQAPVITVYRRGDAVELYPGAPMIPKAKVKASGDALHWLAGVDGEPGRAPRYAPGGAAVEFEVLTGQRTRYPLPGAVPVAQPEHDSSSYSVLKWDRPTPPAAMPSSYVPPPPRRSEPAPQGPAHHPFDDANQPRDTPLGGCRSSGGLCDSGGECCSHICNRGWCL